VLHRATGGTGVCIFLCLSSGTGQKDRKKKGEEEESQVPLASFHYT